MTEGTSGWHQQPYTYFDLLHKCSWTIAACFLLFPFWSAAPVLGCLGHLIWTADGPPTVEALSAEPEGGCFARTTSRSPGWPLPRARWRRFGASERALFSPSEGAIAGERINITSAAGHSGLWTLIHVCCMHVYIYINLEPE